LNLCHICYQCELRVGILESKALAFETLADLTFFVDIENKDLILYNMLINNNPINFIIMNKLVKQIFSWTLVILQFALLFVLIGNMHLDISCLLCIILYVISSSLGIWAIITMKIGNFNIVPDVKPNSILVTEFPYKFIRHPMYTSVLLFSLGMMLSAYSSFTLSIWLILLVVMFVKAKYEESLLIEKFPDYEKYCANTKAFIPFVL